MKILYLICLYNGEINGGHTYRMATVKALLNVVGDGNLDIILSELDTSDWCCNVVMRLKSYTSTKEKIINLVNGNITQRSDEDIKRIISLIKKNNYDTVLFGSSETGKLIKCVKKECPNVKTMTWYHDIVADVIYRKMKNEFSICKLPVWLMEKYSEGIDARLTDVPIVLHQRDAELLKKKWGRDTSVYIPIALEDKFNELACDRVENSDSLQLLFVGAYNWSVNIEAVRWFCEKVMAELVDYNVEFNIAGYQMEKILEDGWVAKYKNVKVLGTVDDLAETYRNVDVVVEPILTGSGMKVKTAEALMHGKEIIGTEEALVGYEELKGQVCLNAGEFIKKILYYYENRPERFVPANRKAYERNYSIKGIENKLRDAIKVSMNK